MAQEKVDNFRSAAVLVPIILRADTPYVVLTVRGANLRKHAGQISFPGGSSEPQDESLVATALRESHEEIGLQPADVKILGYLDDYPTVTGFRVTPVVGLLDAEATMRPDGVEVSEIFEVPLTHLAEDKNYQRDTLMREGLEVPYYAIAHEHYKIWGATAGMLRDLQNKMKHAL